MNNCKYDIMREKVHNIAILQNSTVQTKLAASLNSLVFIFQNFDSAGNTWKADNKIKSTNFPVNLKTIISNRSMVIKARESSKFKETDPCYSFKKHPTKQSFFPVEKQNLEYQHVSSCYNFNEYP